MTSQRAILEALKPMPLALFPERSLWTESNLQLPVPMRWTAFKEALSELEQKGQIVTVESEDRGVCVKLTAAGLARLAEH